MTISGDAGLVKTTTKVSRGVVEQRLGGHIIERTCRCWLFSPLSQIRGWLKRSYERPRLFVAEVLLWCMKWHADISCKVSS